MDRGLAQRARISPYHLHRLFKDTTGVTPRAYASALRARRMREELARSGSVTEALRDCHPSAAVIAVENNPAFARRLSDRLPAVHVVHGCASALPEHLLRFGHDREQVVAVVSGLPMLSLPPDLVASQPD